MTTEAKIIKVGNSQGVRLSRKYLDSLGVKVGDWAEITIRKKKPDKAKAIAALQAIAEGGGPLTKIDVKKWEAQRRAEWEKRDQRLSDIFGR